MILDHLYSPNNAGQSQEIADLKNRVDNLSNITVKNNIQNQILPQQKINQTPTDRQHILRLEDDQFVRIVAHDANTAANTVLQFTMRNNEIQNAKLHSFIIKCAANGVDYVWSTSGWIENRDYKNAFPVMSFSNSNNLTESAKINFWVENSAIKIYSSVPLTSIRVDLKIENNR